MALTPDAESATRSPLVGPALAGVGVMATLLGVVVHEVWREFPAERFLLSLVLAGLVALAAWPLRRATGWSRASAYAAVWAAALVIYVGPLPVGAAMLLGAAAWAIGDRLVPKDAPGRLPVAVTVGLVLIAALGGWSVTLPIHHAWVWGPLLLVPPLLRRHALLAAIREATLGWQGAVDAAPRLSAGAVTLLGLASIACWIPAMQADDLGYHLALPHALLADAAYAPQAEYQKWAFAPWAGDVLHGLVFVLARQESFGALNALWMVLIAGLVGGPLATAMGASPRERWMAAALFGAFPPLVWMAAGMQTELAATAVLLAFAALVLAPRTRDMLDHAWLAGCILVAGLFALKLIHGIAALPLLALAAWNYREARWLRIAPLAIVIASVVGTSSYVQSWIATGNPVLPVLNDVFGSPYASTLPLVDARWLAGFGPDILWRITFDTARYVEGWDGGLGFGLVALAGLLGWRLLRPRQAGLFIVAMLVVLLPLVPLQYARYAWPGIVLLLALLTYGAEGVLGKRAFAWLFVGLCVLNLGYQANASWLHHSAAVKRTIRSVADPSAVFPHYFPERVLLQQVPRGADDLVLASDPTRNVVAELGGRGRTVSPHDPSLAAEAEQANADASGVSWATLLQRERIRWVLVSRESAPPALDAGLRRLGATRVDRLRERELWRLPEPGPGPR